jgi:molybdenum cofactor cytidylyltransferase
MMVRVCTGGVIVVLGAQADVLVRELDGLSCAPIINREWSVGISSSIRCGIEALAVDCDAVLVMTIDQPFIDNDDLTRLSEAWRTHPEYIAVAAYADTIGIPVIFPRRFFDELLALPGARGAKLVLQAHSDSLVSVPMEHAAVDIDTEEDLIRLSDAYRLRQ